MPVILALSIALIAAGLGFRITESVQVFLDRMLEVTQQDQDQFSSEQQFHDALDIFSRSNSLNTVSTMRSNGWKIQGSGEFFNPLLWMGWAEDQRTRFAKGLGKATSSGSIWLRALDNLKKCFPETLSDRQDVFDRCTINTLPEGMALFPTPTPLDINQASITQMQFMMPELPDGVWSKFAYERNRSPFTSMVEFNERFPEMVSVSPLPVGLDTKSRYLWLSWKDEIWLINRQNSLGVPNILFFRRNG